MMMYNIIYIYNHSYDADYGEIVVLMVVLMVVVIMMILMALDYSNKWLQFKPILCAQLCADQHADAMCAALKKSKSLSKQN